MNEQIHLNVFSKDRTMTSRDRNNIRRTLLWVRESKPTIPEIEHVLKSLDLEDSIYFLRKFSLDN